MMRWLNSKRLLLADFVGDESGTVKIEFIIVFPLIIGWIISSFVFFDAYRNFSRASKATFAVADIVSRQTTMNIGNIIVYHDILNGMIPWSDDNKWIRISSLQFTKTSGGAADGDEDGDGVEDCYDADTNAVCQYVVLWSQASGTSQTYLGTNIPQEVIDVLPDISQDDTVILTETHVPYQPLLDNLGLRGMAWKNAQATRPRYVSAIAFQ